MSSPLLEVDIQLARGSLVIDAKFALTAPWTCLFGASGSGKTTILRAIAGFTRPKTGRIALWDQARAETVLFDSSVGTCLSPHRRSVRTAAQQSWLFPGTVRRNVGYGVTWKDHQQCVDFALALLRLEALAETTVSSLSGGERQRVSIARAVAAAVYGVSPAGLLVLDEPFAGLDAALANELAVRLRQELARLKLPVLSVTHDVAEVFVLNAEVIRLRDGKVADQGPAAQVLAEERARLLETLR